MRPRGHDRGGHRHRGELREEGLIIETVFTKDVENICSCHADCCPNVGAVRQLNGGPAIKNYSNFNLMHQKENCIKCGM